MDPVALEAFAWWLHDRKLLIEGARLPESLVKLYFADLKQPAR
jgi:hypothetical protein